MYGTIYPRMAAFHPFLPLAPGCAAVRLSAGVPGIAARLPAYSRTHRRRACSEGTSIMQRIILGCAAFFVLTSPLQGQQAPATQQIPEQTIPPPEVPPSSTQAPTDLPPFIPPPRARLYDHYRTVVHHRARVHQHRTVHHRRRAHHHVTRHHHASQQVVHLSKRTIRTCHRMTYRQILRHGACRELMRRELRASNRHHHASRHRAHRHSRRHRHHR